MVKSGHIFSCHFDDIKDNEVIVKIRKRNLKKHTATNFNVIKKIHWKRAPSRPD